MNKRRMTKLISEMMAVIMIAGFVMSSFNIVKAEETTSTAVTLINGKAVNEAMKKLAGDSLPSDNSIASLYLVNDAKITAFERVDAVNSGAAKENLSIDGSVVAWLNDTTIQWYTNAATVYLNTDCSYMFYGMSSLQSVNGLRTADASRVEDTSYMFAEDTGMTSLDLSGMDTTSVKSMKAMFENMNCLSNLNISDMVTENVTDMSEMFRKDASLTTLDLSSFTVSSDAITTAVSNTASSSSTASSAETNIVDIFKESALSKVYVGYDWKAALINDPKMIRVFTAWFDQTLVMASDTELKDISFTYSLTPGEAISSSDNGAEVIPGIVSSDSYITNSTFRSTDTAIKGTPSDPSFEGKKYMNAKAKVLIDTTQITEPGIYRYIITETTPLEGVDAGLFVLDPSTTRVLDVLAEYENEENISVTASVFHKTQTQLLGKTLDVNEKSSGFDNSYLLTTNDLVIRNSVSGNQGDSRHEYSYKFTVDGDIAGRQLTVVHNDGSVENILIDQNNHGEMNFTLKGSERITIKNIQKRSKYTITAEKELLKDEGIDVKATSSNASAGYSPAVCYSLDTDKSCYITNLSVSEDVDVTFLNIKNGVVPTGIILDTAPYTLSLLMGISGILLIQKKKKVQLSNDDEA